MLLLIAFLPEATIGGVLQEKVFLEISQNLQENTRVWVSLLIKLQASACNFIKKETLAQVFSYDFCEVSKNTFSYRTPSVTASVASHFKIIKNCKLKLSHIF